MYDKNLIINYIKQNAYKKYIDKKIIQEEFNCSEKTSERILKSINYNHMKQSSIDMMKDIEIGIPSPELIIKYDCTLVNLNSFIKRHKITKVYDYRLNNYSDINYFNKINTKNLEKKLDFCLSLGAFSFCTLVLYLVLVLTFFCFFTFSLLLYQGCTKITCY